MSEYSGNTMEFSGTPASANTSTQARTATDALPAAPDLRTQAHPTCVVCSPYHPQGLKLCFALNDQGAAVADFECPTSMEGYPGLLHGGVISMLLDGAMTNCLFLHGHEAVTAQLQVRFRHPVILESPVRLYAWLTEDHPLLYRLEAQLFQNEQLKATAQGIFMPPKNKPGGPVTCL
ncbi:MAG: PaaI family thioesterase [Phycisphaerae bacterium]